MKELQCHCFCWDQSQNVACMKKDHDVSCAMLKVTFMTRRTINWQSESCIKFSDTRESQQKKYPVFLSHILEIRPAKYHCVIGYCAENRVLQCIYSLRKRIFKKIDKKETVQNSFLVCCEEMRTLHCYHVHRPEFQFWVFLLQAGVVGQMSRSKCATFMMTLLLSMEPSAVPTLSTFFVSTCTCTFSNKTSVTFSGVFYKKTFLFV